MGRRAAKRVEPLRNCRYQEFRCGEAKAIPATSQPDEISVPVHKVQYQNDVPGLFEFDPEANAPPRGVTFELVKHTNWAYEREWRVVDRRIMLAENPAHLSSNVIVGLIFGMKISKGDAIKIREAIDSRPASCKPIAYSRMIQYNGGYDLVRTPIPDVDEFIRGL
jgi:hypothetical protein